METVVSRTKLMEEYKIGSSTMYDIKKHGDQLQRFRMQNRMDKKLKKMRKLSTNPNVNNKIMCYMSGKP